MKNLKFLLIPKSNDFKDIINIKEISNELKKKVIIVLAYYLQ